jgi:hypothetical protein
MREIITVQLGQQSNYLGTHFWNTQVSKESLKRVLETRTTTHHVSQESYFTYSDDQEPVIEHDVHWRPGIGADGSETFTPRTVIYDLKGGFGSLRKINALYEVQDDSDAPVQGLW